MQDINPVPEGDQNAMLKLQRDVEELLITQNFVVMKPLHKKLKKALALYDEIEK